MSNIHIDIDREKTFEFDVSLEGDIQRRDMEVRLRVRLNDYTLSFDAIHMGEEKWAVRVPPLAGKCEEGLFPYVVEVMSDGYFFKAVHGEADIGPIADVVSDVPIAKQKQRLVSVDVRSKSPELPDWFTSKVD